MWHTWWQLMRSLTYIFRSSSSSSAEAAAVFAFNTYTFLQTVCMCKHACVSTRTFDKSVELIIRSAHTNIHTHLPSFWIVSIDNKFGDDCEWLFVIAALDFHFFCFGRVFCSICARASANLWNKWNKMKWNEMKLKAIIGCIEQVTGRKETKECSHTHTAVATWRKGDKECIKL